MLPKSLQHKFCLITDYNNYGMIGVYTLRKLYESHQDCVIDEDCLFYPKCCLDHCCDYNEYDSRIIPIYVNNK